LLPSQPSFHQIQSNTSNSHSHSGFNRGVPSLVDLEHNRSCLNEGILDFHGVGSTNFKKISSQCIKLCYKGNIKLATEKLKICIKKQEKDLILDEHNSASIDLFLFYIEAALIFATGYNNHEAYKYLRMARKMSRNFHFPGNEVHFIHIENIQSDLAIRFKNYEKAEDSIQKTEELIKRYEPFVRTTESQEFVIRSRSWNQLHRAKLYLAQNFYTEAIMETKKAFEGFAQVKSERLQALAKEISVRIYIAWSDIEPEQLDFAEVVCNETLQIRFVQNKEIHFYLEGRISQHLGTINKMRKNMRAAQQFYEKAKACYRDSLHQDSELFTELSSQSSFHFSDFCCEDLDLNDTEI